MAAPIAVASATEGARLELLREVALLDTPPEPEFDAIAAEAARLTGYDTALVTLMDHDRCWIKAAAGLLGAPGAPRAIPRNQTYCQHALGSSGFFVVPDGLIDARFSGLLSVTRPGGFRAYAGLQLILPEGLSVGSLCVLNRAPRTPTADDHAALRRLADQALRLIATRRPGAKAPGPVSRDTLLIADDDEGIRKLLEILFERRGVRALIASDGAEALKIYHENAPRIAAVLTDFCMPGIDGLTLVRTLRAEPQPPLCMVMSGRLGDSDRRDFAAAGVHLILDKPVCLVDMDLVGKMVRTAATT